MKLDTYECSRCGEKIYIEVGKKPFTVEYLDGRFSNDELETLHLCDDCLYLFLLAIDVGEDHRKAFDKLAAKFATAVEEVQE